MKKVKAVFYGINGTGLGHLSRLLNIAREARIFLRAMNIKADFHFITTSEASQIAWDFPVYKIPSKTVVAPSDTANQTYAANSQFFIANLMALLRPDILVMDTVPQGSFGEFLSIKAFAKKKIFINRHKNDQYGQSDLHQSMLPLYDLIISPGETHEKLDYHIPESVKDKHVFTSPIHSFKPEDSWSRDEVRNYFGAKSEQKLIYLSAGGGGDQAAETQMKRLIEGALMVPNSLILAAYGPLFRGRKIYHPRVIPLTESGVSKYFGGLDGAISAGGYNTFQELLAAGVPTSFFAQTKGMDMQDLRIQSGQSLGWNRELEQLDQESIKEEIQTLLSTNIQQTIRHNLSNKASDSGSEKAAIELLKLHKSIPHSPISYPEIYLLAIWRKYWWESVKQLSVYNKSEVKVDKLLPESLKFGLLFLRHRNDQYQYVQILEKAQIAYHSQSNKAFMEPYIKLGIQLAVLKITKDLSDRRMKLLISQFVKDEDYSALSIEETFPEIQNFIENKITTFPFPPDQANHINTKDA